MNKSKMNTKNVLVSFLTIVTALFLVATVSASSPIANMSTSIVKVNGINVMDGSTVGVAAGDDVTVKVTFTALEYDTDVTVKAVIEGSKVDVTANSATFDVEKGLTYTKSVTLKIPNDLTDKLSENVDLRVEINGNDHRTEFDTVTLRLQRPSYEASIMSIDSQQTVQAGQSFPVQIVLKDTGYNNLDDLYVTAKITALGIERSGYFGDIVAVECDNGHHVSSTNLPYGSDTLDRNCNENAIDTVSGSIYLDVPYSAKAGVYQIEVDVKNQDTTSTSTSQVTIGNNFEQTVFKSGNSVWIVNPTNNVVGYRIVAESPASVSDSVVFVPAGASKTVTVSPNTEGDYNFNVNVFTMNGQLVNTVPFTGTSSNAASTTKTETNPIVILTVVLAIIFIVLLIVLIVLIGKKPEKSGEFGESYY